MNGVCRSGLAVASFRREVFAALQPKRVAQAAGHLGSDVFRHFATKQELYSAILDHKACTGSASIRAKLSADARATKG